MESFGEKMEKRIAPDVGFQPEVMPEGVPESDLVEFFMEHLSMPKPDGVPPEYHTAELAYYRRLAEGAMATMREPEQRERLRKFLNRE